MSKFLVTGAAGFIGSNIVDTLIDEGHVVYGVDNLSTGKMDNVNDKCEFIKGDIRTIDYSGINVDGIFHTAALARIQPSFKNPAEYEDVNVLGTLRLIDFACKEDAKLIFSSSSSVYGVKDKLTQPLSEDHLLNPQSPYSLQKLTCEKYLEMFHHYRKLNYVALRYFNVYGERQILTGAYAAVVGIFLNQYRTGKPFTIVGNGFQKRDFTYVKDVVQANLLAFESSTESGVFNIGTGTNYSINEVADFISKTHQRETLPTRPGEATETLADSTRALKYLGWASRTDIKDWIHESLNARIQS